jgi:phospholipid/cholesterol/gamma-HCH transport system permease protein
LITALATGMVMSLQFGLGLEKFGGKPYVPKIISLSILRELGPVFTSLMLAARVGAGIASELGAMVVSQQVDAIRALGTSPLKRLVIPRILGSLIAIPTLAVLANLIGLTGAGLVGVFELDLEFSFFYLKVVETVSLADLMTGLAKTVIFAFCISSVACFYGLNVGPGTAGVGQATTRAVVTSMVLILVTNFFLTKLLFYLFLGPG